MNKKELYESIMKNVAKEVKKSLNEDFLVDNAKKFEDSPHYDFYVDIYRYLHFIMDQLSKLSGDPILIKGLKVVGEIPYTHEQVGESFSIGHIIGLTIEEALIKCITTYINGYDGEDDDIADIIDTIGKQGFDIAEGISIVMGRDNQPVHDFKINYLGETYKVQVKAVNYKNEGSNEMNAAIRKGVNLGIIVVYNMLGNDVLIDSLQIYLPDADGTFNYISKNKLGSRRLSLNSQKSFITIGPRIVNGKLYRNR